MISKQHISQERINVLQTTKYIPANIVLFISPSATLSIGVAAYYLKGQRLHAVTCSSFADSRAQQTNLTSAMARLPLPGDAFLLLFGRLYTPNFYVSPILTSCSNA